MNKRDLEILKENYERMKSFLKDGSTDSMDISSSCYVQFGKYGLSCFKYQKSGWIRKIVNGWRDLTWEQFIEKYNDTTWERV